MKYLVYCIAISWLKYFLSLSVIFITEKPGGLSQNIKLFLTSLQVMYRERLFLREKQNA